MASGRHPYREHGRILAAATMGTSVEYYDFFIYATAAALVFGKLFFPAWSAASQTLLAFATFGVAFVARPIGAIAFGHFGDRIGRKATLVASLLLMGGSTVAIGLLPTYATIGWTAPALLCLLRFGQGLGLGGEWGGAALLAVENAPPGWAARFGAAPQLGVPIGFCAANGMFLLLSATLSADQFLSWGWRLPFLASAVLVGIGLWVRFRIAETPAFAALAAREAVLAMPIATLVTRHSRAVAAGSAGVICTYALFYLATAYALAEGTGPLGYPRTSFLLVQLVANLFLAAAVLLSAAYADRTHPARPIMLGALATALLGLIFSHVLAGGLFAAALLLIAANLSLGLNNAALGAWLSRLYPVPVRYSGVALAFNAGGIVGGALTPIAAQALSAAGWSSATGQLLTAAGLATIAGVALARPAA